MSNCICIQYTGICNDLKAYKNGTIYGHMKTQGCLNETPLVWMKEKTPLKMVLVVSKAGIPLVSPANGSAAGVTAPPLSGPR